MQSKKKNKNKRKRLNEEKGKAKMKRKILNEEKCKAKRKRKAEEETAKLSQVVQCVSGLPPPSRCQLSDYQLLGLPLPLQVAGARYQSGWFN